MQIIKSTIVFLFIVIFSHVNAQTIISGVVSDKKGVLITGANVYLENTYDGATTDIDGEFSFATT